MKRLFIIVMCAVLMATMATGALAAEKTYIVGIDGDYPPYSYIGEDGKPTGFDVESVQWIADQLGFKVEIRPTAWDGIVPALLAKKIDMVYSGMTATPERRKVVTFSKPYMVIDQALCVRADSDLNIVTALAGDYKVGTQRGCTAAMWIEDNLVKPGVLPKENLRLYENFPTAAKDLENGRVDSAMMDDVIVERAVMDMDLKIVGTIKTGEEYAVAMRNEDKELQELMNKGIDMLLKSPKWDELQEKYKQ